MRGREHRSIGNVDLPTIYKICNLRVGRILLCQWLSAVFLYTTRREKAVEIGHLNATYRSHLIYSLLIAC